MKYIKIKITDCSLTSCSYFYKKVGSRCGGEYDDINWVYRSVADDNDYTDSTPSACRCKFEVQTISQ